MRGEHYPEIWIPGVWDHWEPQPATFSVFLGKWEIPNCTCLSPLNQETTFEGERSGTYLKGKISAGVTGEKD